MQLSIGKLARYAMVNVETIRYYQRIGLLVEPDKPAVGYRLYSDAYIERIRFIKRAKQLGFTLKEISELLSLGDGHCDDVRTLAEHKRDRIEAQIKSLFAIRQILDKLIDTCHTDQSQERCSIIDVLSDEGKS